MSCTLILAAHPDDEVLGCGGTIRRIVLGGEKVHVAILGEGITARYGQRFAADAELLRQLQRCTEEVAGLLGVSLSMHGLPDNRFDTVPLLDIIKIIEDLVERYKPHTVYTQHGGDLNIDHVMLYRAALTATRPMAGAPVQRLLAYEVASSTEWAFAQFTPVFRPNVFVDISETIETKIRAMQSYTGEARLFPHPRSPESLRAIAGRWGSVCGFEAAEAFELVREAVAAPKGAASWNRSTPPASETVRVRPAKAEDAPVIFGWRNDPYIVARCTFQRTVAWDEHTAWFAKSLSQPDRNLVFVIEIDGCAAGLFRIDRSGDVATVSTYLLERFTGRGLGVTAIRLGCLAAREQWPDLQQIIAWVREENAAGRSAFTKAGFSLGAKRRDGPSGHVAFLLNHTSW